MDVCVEVSVVVYVVEGDDSSHESSASLVNESIIDCISNTPLAHCIAPLKYKYPSPAVH